jgi:hypothetical protein
VAAVLGIAQLTTMIGMPMVSYLMRSRTGAQDSSAQLKELGAVASDDSNDRFSALEPSWSKFFGAGGYPGDCVRRR